MTRHFTHILLLGLAVLFAGCMTRRTSELFAYEIMRGVAGDASEIPFWTQQFESDMHRWPRDLTELRAFVSKRSKGRLTMAYYDRVSFQDQPDGRLRVCCFHGETAGMQYTFLTEKQRELERQRLGAAEPNQHLQATPR